MLNTMLSSWYLDETCNIITWPCDLFHISCFFSLSIDLQENPRDNMGQAKMPSLLTGKALSCDGTNSPISSSVISPILTE